MSAVETQPRGVEHGTYTDVMEASDVPIGHSMRDLGERIVRNDQTLPIDSIPVIDYHIQEAINRLYAERCMPCANVALIDQKIGLLMEAKTHVLDAGACLSITHDALVEYVGGTAITFD